MTRPPDANVEQCAACQKWNDSDMVHCRWCGHRTGNDIPTVLGSVPVLKSTGGPERARTGLRVRARDQVSGKLKWAPPSNTRARGLHLMLRVSPVGHDVIYVRRPVEREAEKATAARQPVSRYLDRFGWYLAARSIVRAIVGTYRFGIRHWVGLAPWYGYILALVVHGLVFGVPGTNMAQTYAILACAVSAWWYVHRFRKGPRAVPVDRSALSGTRRRQARRTALKLVRGWLVHMRNADMVGTELRRVALDQWSVTMDIHTTHKLGVSEIRSRLEKLERCFPDIRYGASRVERLTGPGKFARDARLRFMTADPFAEPIPLLSHDGDSHMIPIGLFETGQEVLINVLQHLLIAGMSGAGKSNLMQVIIRMLTHIPWVAVVLVDLTPGATEFTRWAGRVAAVVTSTDDTRLALDLLKEEFNRRGDLMTERGWQNWKPTALEPQIVFIVDEAQGIAHAKLHKKLNNVAALARKYGGTLILATQHPKDDNLPTDVKVQMRQTIGLRTKDEGASRVIFGEGATKDGWNTKRLDNNRFLIETEHGYRDPLQAKATYLSGEVLANEVMTTPHVTAVREITWPIESSTAPAIEDHEQDVIDAQLVEPSTTEKVYEALHEDGSVTHRTEIEQLTGLHQTNVDLHLKQLIKLGRAEKVGRARYRRVQH